MLKDRYCISIFIMSGLIKWLYIKIKYKMNDKMFNYYTSWKLKYHFHYYLMFTKRHSSKPWSYCANWRRFRHQVCLYVCSCGQFPISSSMVPPMQSQNPSPLVAEILNNKYYINWINIHQNILEINKWTCFHLKEIKWNIKNMFPVPRNDCEIKATA